jgi:hypothetical protein
MRPSNSDLNGTARTRTCCRQDPTAADAAPEPPRVADVLSEANASTHDDLIERLEHGRFAARQQVDRRRIQTNGDLQQLRQYRR